MDKDVNNQPMTYRPRLYLFTIAKNNMTQSEFLNARNKKLEDV